MANVSKDAYTGVFPESGTYSVKYWARVVFGVTEKNVYEWIAEHKIPFKVGPGGRFVRAEDFWSALPSNVPEAEKPKGRGGKARKN